MEYTEYTEAVRQQLIAAGYKFVSPGRWLDAEEVDHDPRHEEAHMAINPLREDNGRCFPIDSDEAKNLTDIDLVQYHVKTPF